MEKYIPRIRDFIETKEGLIFASVSYLHPPEGYLAFLRYYPDEEGDREREGKSYRKVASTEESFTFLERNFPEYILAPNLQGVPMGRVSRIHLPTERLKEIARDPRNGFEQKVAALSDAFAEIDEQKKGVTGSALLGMQTASSDIDFVVYGSENFHRARDILVEIFEQGGNIRPLNEQEWGAAYGKRFGTQGELGFEEFVSYEKRKGNRGVICDTLFDILFARDRDEIDAQCDTNFERQGRKKVRCRVTDASFAFDSPAVYRVECEAPDLKEVASFTHTYAGQALEGEDIEVSGVLERAKGGDEHLRIIVGTTREAKGEYIKLYKKEIGLR